MKLKYYLKGLGIGMIISAALLGALYYFNTDAGMMTDAQVIERARQLGMVEDVRMESEDELFETVDIPDPIVDETPGEAVLEEGTQVSEENDEGLFVPADEGEEVVDGTWSNDPQTQQEETPE